MYLFNGVDMSVPLFLELHSFLEAALPHRGRHHRPGPRRALAAPTSFAETTEVPQSGLRLADAKREKSAREERVACLLAVVGRGSGQHDVQGLAEERLQHLVGREDRRRLAEAVVGTNFHRHLYVPLPELNEELAPRVKHELSAYEGVAAPVSDQPPLRLLSLRRRLDLREVVSEEVVGDDIAAVSPC